MNCQRAKKRQSHQLRPFAVVLHGKWAKHSSTTIGGVFLYIF